MGQPLIPPYEDMRDNTPRWQAFEKRLEFQAWLMVGLAGVVGLFLITVVIWVVAAGRN